MRGPISPVVWVGLLAARSSASCTTAQRHTPGIGSFHKEHGEGNSSPFTCVVSGFESY